MTRKTYPRPARKAAVTVEPLTKDPNEVIVASSTSPPTTTTTATTTMGTIFAVASATPLAASTTGSKRRRDDDEDCKGEDAFYGRRSAKGRSKGSKNFERKDIELEEKDNSNEKGSNTPIRVPATTSKELGKRLKFDPEVHGAGLEARFLDLQKNDSFEKMVSPRKKATKDTGEVGELDGTTKNFWEISRWTDGSAPRKIATPKSIKKVSSKPLSVKRKKQEPAQAGPSSEPQFIDCETPQDIKDKTHDTTSNKPITAPISKSLTLEKRLQRLTSPKIGSPQPARSRTVNNSFSSSPATIKSSKPLTKPSFELPGDAHMRKRVAEREERKKRMEEADKQKEEVKKQQQLQERFKTHFEKNVVKKDQQQGSNPQASRPPATKSTSSVTPPTESKLSATSATATAQPEPIQALASRRDTLDEVNKQLSNETELEESKRAEEAVLRIRQEAAEKGKESARIWAEQMKMKAAKNGS